MPDGVAADVGRAVDGLEGFGEGGAPEMELGLDEVEGFAGMGF